MAAITSILFGTACSWILLLIVIPISQKLVEFSMPDWPERLWKLAVVAGAINVTGSCIAMIPGTLWPWVGMIASAVVAYILLVKWFDIDLFGGAVIVFVSQIVQNLLLPPIYLALR